MVLVVPATAYVGSCQIIRIQFGLIQRTLQHSQRYKIFKGYCSHGFPPISGKPYGKYRVFKSGGGGGVAVALFLVECKCKI